MEAIATQKYVRMSPRKLRLVVSLIKKLTPVAAVTNLPYVQKRAAKPVEKVIKTAMANARQKGAKDEDLVFKEIQITEGPTLKRGRPVSRGQWHPIMKRMSHIRVVVMTNPKLEEKVMKKAKEESKETIREEKPLKPKARKTK